MVALRRAALVTLWLVLSTALSVGPVSAQDDEIPPPLPAVAPRPPSYRLDVDLLTPSVFFTTRASAPDVLLSGQVGLRLALPSGAGAFLDGSFSAGFLGPFYVLGEAGYLHRFRLFGDDARGLGLDLEGGMSAGEVSAVTNGGGAVLGPNAALSLDWREGAFVVGLMVRYRALFEVETGAVEHAPSITLRVTFGFWE